MSAYDKKRRKLKKGKMNEQNGKSQEVPVIATLTVQLTETGWVTNMNASTNLSPAQLAQLGMALAVAQAKCVNSVLVMEQQQMQAKKPSIFLPDGSVPPPRF